MSLDAHRRSARYAVWISALVSLVVFLSRFCRTIYVQDDSPEMVTAAAVWGIPHAPGFPVYSLVGHLFTKLPILSVAARVNLSSAIFHALTVGIVGLCVARVTRSWAAVLGASLSLAFSRAFLLGSLYAEVFPLNDLFFAILLCLALHAADRDVAPATRTRAIGHMAWVLGLAAAHQPMIVLGIPALAAIAGGELVACVRARPRRALVFLLLGVAPFVASYALVLIAAAREPWLSSGDVRDLRGLVRLILREDYGGLMSASRRHTHADAVQRIGYFFRLVHLSIGWRGFALALAGLAAIRRQGTLALGLLLGFLGCGPMFALMGAAIHPMEEYAAIMERFVTMCLLPLALLWASAIAAAEAWAMRLLTRAPAIGTARMSLAVIFPVLAFVDGRKIDLHDDARGVAYVHDLIDSTEDGSLILVMGDLAGQAALYACGVEKMCGSRVIIPPGELFLPWKRAQLRHRHPDVWIPEPPHATSREGHLLVEGPIKTRPVYVSTDAFTRDPVFSHFTFVPHGLLLRLYPTEDLAMAERAAFLERARALADGRGCEGCALRQSQLLHPSFEAALVGVYAAALKNHALVVRRMAGDPSVAAALEARAAAMQDEEENGAWSDL